MDYRPRLVGTGPGYRRPDNVHVVPLPACAR